MLTKQTSFNASLRYTSYTLDHVQIITMQTLGGVGAMHKNFTYLPALCMLEAFFYLRTFYAQNYDGIIGAGLQLSYTCA